MSWPTLSQAKILEKKSSGSLTLDSGFTLAEILVTITLTLIIAVVTGQLLSMGMQSARSARALLELSDLKNELQNSFQIKSNCRRAFNNNDTLVIPFGDFAVLDDSIHPYTLPLDIYNVVPAPGGAQAIKLRKASPATVGGLVVTGVNFQSIDHTQSNNALEYIFHGTINITAQRSAIGVGSAVIQGSFPIAFVVKRSGATTFAIDSCRSIAPDSGRPQTLPACTPGQFLSYSRTNSRWECQAAH